MTVPAPMARSRFAALAAGDEATLDLARAALLVAAEEYPQLTPEPYLRRLDLLAERVKDRLSDEGAPPVVLQEVSRVLFEEEGFRGNAEAYYDPRNSFLNDVLDRKLGVPLTLSLVVLEVGWRLGLPVAGVNFPGHFLIRYDGEALALLIDPFQRGEILFEDQAQELLDRIYGDSVRLQPEFLRPVGKKDILARLLMNLKTVYLNARDDARALAVIERLMLVRPAAIEEVRDRGMLLARTGRVEEAGVDLRHYLDARPESPDAERVKLLLSQLRQEPR